MSIYINPFFARASEQHRDTHQFVSTFGAGALDMLPSAAWDRLVLLRSSPGTGKTSLMRLFTVENLEWARSRMKSEPVHRQLLELGAIDKSHPLKLGVLIDLDRDYRSLLDLPMDKDASRRLFLRLLDVRILVGALRAALAMHGRSFPGDIGHVRFDVRDGDSGVEARLERMGGPTGAGILDYARTTERAIVRLLDALLAADVNEVPHGHNELHSLSVLATADIFVAEAPLHAQPLVMFDDGHRLNPSQRDTLLKELRLRRPSVARWYAERFEALSDQDLLGDLGNEGRDVALVNLDSVAREGSSDGKRFTKGRYDKVLTDIARRRAAPMLAVYAQEHQQFLELLDDDRDVLLRDSGKPVLDTLEGRVVELAGDEARYARWLADARRMSGFDAAIRWRELEVLILRDQDRQQDLFGAALTGDDIETRSSAALREAAALAVANEFRLPYYAGPSMVVRLGSHNAHQFLNICGDLFAEMLVDVSLGRPPRLNVARQHRVLHQASERMWQAIPRTVPHGRDVQAVVREIVAIAQEAGAKPTMPYPPGVTGTAMLMSERNALLDPKYRAKNPGADRLLSALAAAVAHNVLHAELDYSVKNNRFMVLYLNRLLCPRFGLPLGLGGFRERRLRVMTGWMQKLPAYGTQRRSEPVEERLAL